MRTRAHTHTPLKHTCAPSPCTPCTSGRTQRLAGPALHLLSVTPPLPRTSSPHTSPCSTQLRDLHGLRVDQLLLGGQKALQVVALTSHSLKRTLQLRYLVVARAQLPCQLPKLCMLLHGVRTRGAYVLSKHLCIGARSLVWCSVSARSLV